MREVTRAEDYVEMYFQDGQRVAMVDEKDVWYKLTKMTKEDRHQLFPQKAALADKQPEV